MIRKLSRDDLYAKVWERPVKWVAADLDISDVALHKICRKHQIPVPPRGYWAKVAAGRPVPVPKLGTVKDTRLEEIEIIGAPTSRLDPEVLKAAKAKSLTPDNRASDPTRDLDAYTDSHLEELQRRLDVAKPKRDGLIRFSGKTSFNLAVTPALAERVVRTIRRILAIASAHGHELGRKDGVLALSIDGELISLSVSELLERRPHEPSAQEAAKLARWKVQYQRQVRLKGWAPDWDRPKIPEWDEVPSGRLAVEIDQPPHTDGLRRRFSDGKTQRVENLAEEILVSTTACALAAKKRREERAEFARRMELDRKRREEAERRRRLYDKRWECAELVIEYLSRAHKLQELAEAYREAFGEPALAGPAGQFMSWAEQEATRLRANVDPERLGAAIDRFGLMNDDADIRSWEKFTLRI